MHKPTFRVIQVLELVCAAGEPLRLSQISKTLEVPKSTLLPILQTMVENRYLSRDEAEKYCPGPGLLGVGAAAKAYHSPEDTIRECLEPMVAQFGETCYYGVLDGGYVRYVEKVDSPQPLRMLTTIGHRLPAYATGLGKALLLDKTPEQLKKLYPDKLEQLTPHTVKDLKALGQQLQKMKALGYSWEEEESTEHIRCFAAPVRRNGVIEGSVSIAIPIFRYNEANREAIVAALQETAQRLSQELKNVT